MPKSCLVFASAVALAVAGCAEPAAVAVDSDTPTRDPLPLDKRIVYVKDYVATGAKVTKHAAVFGNWAAECSWSRGGAREEVSWCDVYPWNGVLPKRQSVLIPYADRATVQYFQKKPVKIVLNTAARDADGGLRYACGGLEWRDDGRGAHLKFFYDEEAKRFVSQMRASDCKIIYRARGAAAQTEIVRIARGFSQANDYASSFSSYPKPVDAPR